MAEGLQRAFAAAKRTRPEHYADCKKRGYHRLTPDSGVYCTHCGRRANTDDLEIRRG